MRCPGCDRENDETAAFCQACGAGLNDRTRLTAPSGTTMQALSDTRPRAGCLDDALGSTVAGYRIIRKLGQGGMGAVYLAEQVKLQRRAAIKVLPPALSQHAPLIERFEREARALARLDHPHIVPVYDLFEHAGTLCIAMAYLEGGSVRDLLRAEGFLDEARAAAIVAGAARGLWAAAEKGIVHRDVKPDNLLLASDGTVKVADFGLVRAAGGAELTSPGTVLGTPAYMAPEQWEDARDCDHRSDLYALGCTLFQLLYSRPPFPGPQAQQFLKQHLHDPPPELAAKRPDLSPQMLKIVDRLLAKEPGKRFPSGAELAAHLEPLAAAPAALRPSRLGASGRRRERTGRLLLVLVLVLLLGAGLHLAWTQLRAARNAPLQAEVLAAQATAAALFERVTAARAALDRDVEQAEEWVRRDEAALAGVRAGTMEQAQLRGNLKQNLRRLQRAQEVAAFADRGFAAPGAMLAVDSRLREAGALVERAAWTEAAEDLAWVIEQLEPADRSLPHIGDCLDAREEAEAARRAFEGWAHGELEVPGAQLGAPFAQEQDEGHRRLEAGQLAVATAHFQAACDGYDELHQRLSALLDGLRGVALERDGVADAWKAWLDHNGRDPALEPGLDNEGALLHRLRNRYDEVRKALLAGELDSAERALLAAQRAAEAAEEAFTELE